jgi:ribosome-associated protein
MGKTDKKRAASGRRLARACVKAALEKKAMDVMVLDMRGISSITDYFFICSGSSYRQAKTIATNIREEVERSGQRCYHSEGWPDSQWIVLDFGDVIAHVFCEESRRYYNLERLWGDAKLVDSGEQSGERM